MQYNVTVHDDFTTDNIWTSACPQIKWNGTIHFKGTETRWPVVYMAKVWTCTDIHESLDMHIHP